MTAKEYLRQAHRLDERINAHIAELEGLRDMSTRIQGCGFEEHISGTRSTDPPFVRVLVKIIDMQHHINDEIDQLVDLKAEMDRAIAKLDNVEERLLLRYRYINNYDWDDIAATLNVSYRTVHRIHASALQNFEVPE